MPDRSLRIRCERYSSRFVAAAVVLFFIVPFLRADEIEERRLNAGIRLFRSLLAADLDLQRKLSPANELLVLFITQEKSRRGNELALSFATSSKEKGKVRNIPVATEVLTDTTLAAYQKRTPSAIFICDPLDKKALSTIVRYGIDHRIIVFSPFEGHVESGVLGGISVEAQVRPYINQVTLQASRISLKQFFLDVAKAYR